MEKLSNIPEFGLFKKNETSKNPTLAQRQQMSKFTFNAYINMGCEVIYLTEATRTIVGDEMCTLNRELQTRSRFGRTTDVDLVQLKQISATKSDLENDPAFKKAWIVENRHFFNPDDPNHKTVESENILRTFDFAEKMITQLFT